MRFLLVPLLLAVGFALPADAQQAGKDARQAILLANAKAVAAYNRHDAEAIAHEFTDDAVVVTPEGMIAGRPAIQEFYAGEFKTMDPRNYVQVVDKLSISGNQAWIVGHWSGIFAAGGSTAASKGYVAMVLERRGAGWKARMTIFNIAPPG